MGWNIGAAQSGGTDIGAGQAGVSAAIPASGGTVSGTFVPISAEAVATVGQTEDGVISGTFVPLSGSGSANTATLSYYYIDFDSGSDANDGLTQGNAWKHCPGDDNATGVPAAHNPAPGDNFAFRGGVTYRGEVYHSGNGTPTEPIGYYGSVWGTGKAIVSALEEASFTWTQCTSELDAGGNPEWANIWKSPIPPEVTTVFQIMLYDGTTKYLMNSQDRPPVDYPVIMDYEGLLAEHSPADVTSTSLVSTESFSSSHIDAFDDSWVGVWISNNTLVYRPILTFNSSLSRVTFATVQSGSSSVTTTQDREHIVVGSPIHVSVPGMWGVRGFGDVAGRVYMYPPTGVADPNTMTIETSVRGFVFQSNQNTDIVIDGFSIIGSSENTLNHLREGGGIRFNNTSTGGKITITNNEVSYCRSILKNFAVKFPPGLDSALFESNHIHDCSTRGVSPEANSLVSKSLFERLGGTAARIINGVSNVTYDLNTLREIVGLHGNGLTAYGLSSSVGMCENIVISRNRLTDCGLGLTIKWCRSPMIFGNVFDGAGKSFPSYNADWGFCSGTPTWINNTFANYINPPFTKSSLVISSGVVVGDLPTHTFINNVIKAGGKQRDDLISYGQYAEANAYTARAWYQSEVDGWALGTGEFDALEEDCFVDIAGGDFRPLAGGPLIDVGADISAYGFTEDIEGNTIPTDGVWTIGALQPETPTTSSGAVIDASFTVVSVSGTASRQTSSQTTIMPPVMFTDDAPVAVKFTDDQPDVVVVTP